MRCSLWRARTSAEGRRRQRRVSQGRHPGHSSAAELGRRRHFELRHQPRARQGEVLAEAFRVLKPGGRFAVSDVVVRGEVPPALRRDMELWVGCIAGALGEDEYKAKLSRRGFQDIDRRNMACLRTSSPGEADGQIRQRIHPGEEAEPDWHGNGNRWGR